MSDLIDRKPLYERAVRLEAEALDYASKLIERGRVGEVTSEDWRIWSAVLAERTAFKHDVFDAPSAEPERKKGRWERHYSRPNVFADLFWHCSCCGYKNENQYANVYHKFCPNCGFPMEVGEEDGERKNHS